MAMSKQHNTALTVATDLVFTKYTVAGKIANEVLEECLAKCIPDAIILDICCFGDSRITERTSNEFKTYRGMTKGVAFPVCVCVNDIIAQYSPLKSDIQVPLKNGDLVKIELGVHVDGFCALVAHSIVVGASAEQQTTGPKADVMMAAHLAAEATLKLIKPGVTTDTVIDAVKKITQAYHCNPVENLLSYQMEQFEIEGNKQFSMNHTAWQPTLEFKLHEVYRIDICVSTKKGTMKDVATSTTIYKLMDGPHNTRVRLVRALMDRIKQRFGRLPFSQRALAEMKGGTAGLKKCKAETFLQDFPVYRDGSGGYVARIMKTIVLMPKGLKQLTGIPVKTTALNSIYNVEEDLIDLVYGK